ncbi:MAG: hypothetical protein LRY71_00790 [Bacillaceae bacterium]|nr:hypothetical protein [Bacillaceae bacterium]
MLYVAEHIKSYDRDKAHYFMELLLKSLPIKRGEIEFELDGVELKLKFNKTPMKREADLQMKLEETFYSCKHLHSKLNVVPSMIVGELVAFVLNHETELEQKINELM